MAATSTSPVKILLDLGIDLDNLSSEENYLSALMEGAAAIESATKGKVMEDRQYYEKKL